MNINIERFFPFFISSLTALFGILIQYIFYSSNPDVNFLSESLAEISLPFFGVALLLVVLREDILKSDNGEELLKNNKLPLGIFYIIFFSSASIFLLSLFIFSLKSALFSLIYLICSLYIYLSVARLRAKGNQYISLSINILILFFVILFLVFSTRYEIRVSLLEVYATSALIVLIITICKDGFFRHSKTSHTNVNIINILSNLVFVIAPAIEGYLYYYFNSIDYNHLAFIHRVSIVMTGVFVNYIFFYFDKFKRIKAKSINFIFLIMPFLLSFIFILFAMLFMKFNIFSSVFEPMNLKIDKIYLLTMFIIPAYIFNAFTYVILRMSGGKLYSFLQILTIVIFYSVALLFAITSKLSIYSYGFIYALLWVLLFILSYKKFSRIKKSVL